MGGWNNPKTLEKLSSEAIVRNFLITQKCAISTFKQNNDNKIHMFQNIIIPNIYNWWKKIPAALRSSRKSLQVSIDEMTEVNPNLEIGYSERVLYFFMKIIILEEVFIDRDYETLEICLIPAALESTVVELVTTCCWEPFPMKKLSLYGPLFPDITETILENASNLEVVAMSHKNITNDVMVAIGKNCPNLVRLQFIHYNIGSSVSVEAFTKGLFNNSSKEIIRKSYRRKDSIPVSFPNLRLLECGMSLSSFDIPLCLWVLFYYKHLNYLCIDWRANVFESGNNQITQDILFPLIINTNKVFALKELFLNINFLTSLNRSTLNILSKSMPKTEKIFLDCNIFRSTESELLVGGNYLKCLAKSFNFINSLYVNNRNDTISLKLIRPMLTTVGTNMQSLTIDCECQTQKFLLNTLYEVLNYCPLLLQLKLMFPTRYVINYNPIQDGSFTLPSNKLRELWFHEVTPWEAQNVDFYELKTLQWLKLLKILQSSSPDLKILSTTTCDSMSIVFDKLSSNVSTFHLHIKDGCESVISFTEIKNMVKRFPNLRYLFLEELEGDIFWKIKDYFATSDLYIFWGNLDGWPRT